ncbi:hypothetical protein SRB17_78880 [Streptomyces sp. RB17]|uniref:hypothetical protein n=1 Tax=Streptomyces sp. RB17 TaxID=2585197 RepID=UPI00129593F3|nr:hypothetical protein [Streptomyces sp. RB17]MQY39860.1 hypothetical protein [Streptomyces sp. RB17]
MADPTNGLFSATLCRKGATLGMMIENLENDIVFGRKPVSAWKPGVRDWLNAGGRQIADEFGAAHRSARR